MNVYLVSIEGTLTKKLTSSVPNQIQVREWMENERGRMRIGLLYLVVRVAPDLIKQSTPLRCIVQRLSTVFMSIALCKQVTSRFSTKYRCVAKPFLCFISAVIQSNDGSVQLKHPTSIRLHSRSTICSQVETTVRQQALSP